MYKTLVLSLVKDVDRREHITNVLQDLQLEFEFFDAKTPDDVTPELKQSFFSDIDIYSWDINHDNVLATFLSHLSILEYSHINQQNILLIEDDMESLRQFDFASIDFDQFDIYNLSDKISCCAYFINHQSAKKIINHLLSNKITQAFDWELYKLKDSFTIKVVDEPIFRQCNKFTSNLAPNGYKKISNS